MGKVYANAARVLAWLGSESDNSDLAFDYLNGMGDEPRDDEKLSEDIERRRLSETSCRKNMN
jgi:hypothetical protein